MDPTPEQAEAVAAYGDGTDLVLQAGAGCGKSTTLKQVARSDPRARMVCVVYNKANKVDAERSMPSNVSCKTGHGLAFDPKYLPRLNMPKQSAHVAAQIIDVPHILGITGAVAIPVTTDDGQKTPLTSKKIMRFAKETLTRFCTSSDQLIGPEHLPTVTLMHNAEARSALAEFVLPVAHTAWLDIQREDGRLRMDHDHYLKLWALGDPVLETDVVLLDEGQDTNDVLAAVLLAQEHAQRICVGDSAQAIYEWRGARDALAKFPGDVLNLSQSFRFGPAIADEANAWLTLVGTELRLRGFEPTPSRVGPVDSPDAILCRTNAGAMGAVLEALERGVRVALVGGGGAIQALARAADDLLAGKPTDHPEFSAFTTWGQLEEYADEEDPSLRVLVDLINGHGTDRIIKAASQLSAEAGAELVVSTAHRSKGREWPKVRIHGDFRPPKPDAKTGLKILRREEARLAYVAVTRARQELDCEALAWRSDPSIAVAA